MDDALLSISQLSVAVEGKEILHDVDMVIRKGNTHALFGPNGSGKSTLLMAIMGFPRYQILKGTITFKGKDITNLPLDERARLGIGMSFQRPPVVRGVRTLDIVAACLKGQGNQESIDKLAEEANMMDFLGREINYGFSGGEIKRCELMQLLAQKPELSLLDEPESGVDLINIALIGQLINKLLEKDCPMHARKCMGLIITHTGHILNYVSALTGYVMLNGRIACEGDPREILATIKEKGYEKCAKCMK